MRILISFLLVLQFGLIASVNAQDDSSSKQQAIPSIKDSVPAVATVKDTTVKHLPKKKKLIAPTADSLAKKDSVLTKKVIPASVKDSASPSIPDSTAHSAPDTASVHVAHTLPPPVEIKKPLALPVEERVIQSKDWLFYIILLVLLFLAFLKTGFSKYFFDMFRIFWNTSFRQKQIRDQLQQAALPSLLFNVFFVVSGGLFAFLAVQQLEKNLQMNHWLLLGLCMLILVVIYLAKYFILKLTGWVFGQEEAAETYIFIVFLVNKVMAVVLLPLILILAFADPVLRSIAFTFAILLIIFLLGYRFIRSYTTIRNELRISQLHFFLYVCSFEVIPVLLIYKLLINLFERTL